MSDNSQRNSVLNTAADSKVYHAQLNDIGKHTPGTLGHLQRGGIRTGEGRNIDRTQEMLDKIPPSQRSGIDDRAATAQVKEYLADKDASHIKSHSKGGSSHPNNIKWEDRTTNRSRGDRQMTQQEQIQLDVKAQIDNLTGALKAGLESAPRGAVVGAVTTAPFSMLRNALRVMRGELSAQEAAVKTVKETVIGGGVGAATAFTVTSFATACPPIAIALTAISPVLLVAGSAGIVYEFFNILDDHKQQVKEYYKSLTKRDLKYLQEMENELLYEHSKNLDFLNEAQLLNAEITNRPLEAGVEGALKRYLESSAIAQSLGVISVENKQLPSSQNSLHSTY